MITLKLTLDQRRKRADGTYPIVFRITVKSSSRDFKTDFSAKEEDWNFKTDAVKESHPDFIIVFNRVKEL